MMCLCEREDWKRETEREREREIERQRKRERERARARERESETTVRNTEAKQQGNVISTSEVQ